MFCLFFCFFFVFFKILFICLFNFSCVGSSFLYELSLAAASGGHSSSRCAGPSLSWPLLLRSTGSRRTGSVVVAHGPSCSTACGIFPDQGSNPCPLHWQADSQPLRHQGSPTCLISNVGNMCLFSFEHCFILHYIYCICIFFCDMLLLTVLKWYAFRLTS